MSPSSPTSAHPIDASSVNSTFASLRNAMEAEIARNPAAKGELIRLAEWLLQRLSSISHTGTPPPPAFPYPYFDASVQLSDDAAIVPGSTVTLDSPCYDLFQVRPDLYQRIVDINARWSIVYPQDPTADDDCEELKGK
jgi:hypothetical protein